MSYSAETIKGYRRILRTLFNEAVRYEWITKNPVCGTKIGAGNSNTSLRAVPEKEVFSFKEAQEFLELLSQSLPIQTVSKYMGHSDSTVTLEVYSHFIPDTQEKVVFALNNITKK